MNPSDSHFLPAEKLLRATNKKMDNDVIKNTQSYAEKVITDIINRAALLTRHVDKEVIDAHEISIVVEKDFDYSFGLRSVFEEVNMPTAEHIDRMAEISRQSNLMGLSNIKEEFSVEDHYESKIRQGSISDHGAVLRFIRKPFTPKIHEQNKGFRRIIKDRFKYEDFLEITKLHNEYLRELKGNLGPKSFMDLIYKAELTGAKIVISNKEGIVVEERKNSLSVIFPGNIIKIYPKNTWNFKLHFEAPMQEAKAALETLINKFDSKTFTETLSQINEEAQKAENIFLHEKELMLDEIGQISRRNKQLESDIERLQLFQAKNSNTFAKRNNERIKLSRRIIELEEENEDMESRLKDKEISLSALENEIKALSYPSLDELYYEVIRGFGVEFIEKDEKTYARIKNKSKNDIFMVECNEDDVQNVCENIWEKMN